MISVQRLEEWAEMEQTHKEWEEGGKVESRQEF